MCKIISKCYIWKNGEKHYIDIMVVDTSIIDKKVEKKMEASID